MHTEAQTASALWERYSRQMLFAPLGRAGQERLRRAHAAIVGCGALGSTQADLLARAGIGRLTLVDRDYVEASNLQRQRLYDEADARESLPKATAAARHLRHINSEVEIMPRAEDLNAGNIEDLLAGAEIILDGTDNLDTRYLLNDYAVARRLPWIYGAVVGAYGTTFTIRPGETACLECLFGAQPAGLVETCDTRGVLNWAVQWVAAWQAGEAVKLAAGASEALRPTLIAADLWTNEWRELQPPPRDPDCRACVRGDFVYLRGERQPRITLCGRDGVQIHEHRRHMAFAPLAERLAALGDVRYNDFILKFRPHPESEPRPLELTLFADGRAIVKGTTDPAAARSAYARYLGA
ncbi:MAG TPA: ThiF family adenylyltransferase [Terriglobales bacterium]|nr:ThiF family adenylyltransferase [Terriglobales bacterium]